MMRNAADVKAHWSTLNQGREPRIWTFAAGALPYAYLDAYIFEALVSFRHRCPPEEEGSRSDGRVWRAHADYIHAFTRHGRLPRLLAPVRERRKLISEQPFISMDVMRASSCSTIPHHCRTRCHRVLMPPAWMW